MIVGLLFKYRLLLLHQTHIVVIILHSRQVQVCDVFHPQHCSLRPTLVGLGNTVALLPSCAETLQPPSVINILNAWTGAGRAEF